MGLMWACFRVWYPNGIVCFFFTILVSAWVQIFGLVGTPLPTSRGRTPRVLFVSHQSDQPFLRYGQNSVWPWKKHIRNFWRKFAKIKATMLCSDPMSGSHFIAQTSKFLLINATAMTLGQGLGKVIQYIFPDPYIHCAKYLRFTWNSFDVRGKSFCGGGRGGRNELKT